MLQCWYNMPRYTLKIPEFLQKIPGIWKHRKEMLGIWMTPKITPDLKFYSLKILLAPCWFMWGVTPLG